jgi:hypothetical protein
MRTGSIGAAVVTWALVLYPGASAGQTQQAPPPQSQSGITPSVDQTQSLGISLDRIRRKLREAPPTGASSPLRLEYHIEVIGTAPKIDFFSGFDIGKLSPVQYGGMTHAEFLHITRPPWRKR